VTWLAWAIVGVAAVAAYFTAFALERKRMRGLRDEVAFLRADNAMLTHQAASLAADLREARRAPLSHADARERLLRVAEADADG
jgi:hypothetical protein